MDTRREDGVYLRMSDLTLAARALARPVLPGGVQASSGDWTKAERLFVGMGRAIFSSLCLASAACTASVWMSARPARRSSRGESHRGEGGRSVETGRYLQNLEGRGPDPNRTGA